MTTAWRSRPASFSPFQNDHSGTLSAQATLRHGGRTTQIWDAEVSDEQGKVIALFRCTQLVLYPRI